MVVESGYCVIKIDLHSATQIRVAIMTPSCTDEPTFIPAREAEIFLRKQEVTDVINSLVNLQKSLR